MVSMVKLEAKQGIEESARLIPLEKLLELLELEIVESIKPGDGGVDPSLLGKYVSSNEYFMIEVDKGSFLCRLLLGGSIVLNGECRQGGERIPVDSSIVNSILHSDNIRGLTIYRVKSPLVKWLDRYRLGVKSMDVEHEAMFEKFNQVLTHIVEGEVEKAVEALREAYDLALRHLEVEEKLMKKYKYDRKLMREHLEKHDEFKDMLSKLMKTKNSLEFINMFTGVFEYLLTYLNYMLDDDLKLAEYLRSVCGDNCSP